jgi:hypothetical protein
LCVILSAIPKAGAIVAKRIGHNKGPDAAFVIERDAPRHSAGIGHASLACRAWPETPGSGPTRLWIETKSDYPDCMRNGETGRLDCGV